MKWLTRLALIFAVLLMSASVHAQSTAIQLCSDEDTTTGPGTCYFLRAASSLSAGLGGAAGIRTVPASAVLYAHSAAGIPLVLHVGAGTDANALRVVAASNSPDTTALTAIQTAVETLVDWDESDRAAVNLISGQAGVDGNTGSAAATTLRVVEADDGPVGLAHAQADDDQTDACTALTAASQQYTIPQTGDYYCIKAIGNTAYILGGSNPTATTSANGHVYPVSDGESLCIRVNSDKVAFIANSAAGEICFLRLSSSL